MSLDFRQTNSESTTKYFLYLKVGQIAKSIFVKHPILSALSLFLAYRLLKRAGVDFADLKKLGGKLIQTHRRINALVVEFKTTLTPEQLQWIKDRLHVDIEPVKQVTACMDIAVTQTGVKSVWNDLGLYGEGIKVAVVDTGINDSHPDLKGRVLARQNFTQDAMLSVKTQSNFLDGIFKFIQDLFGSKVEQPSKLDPVGHGTHCAGIIGGNGSKYTGVAPKVVFLDARVLNNKGQGSTDSVIQGMSWAASQGADVISMSLGGPGDSDDAISREANALAKDGVVVVVAAGNEGPRNGTIGSPGAAEHVITVASVDHGNALVNYSSRGPVLDKNSKRDLNKPDICAPGGGVSSGSCPYAPGIVATKSADTPDNACTVKEGSVSYQKMSGTSMATPHVAGACALILEAARLDKSVKNKCELVKNAIKETAKKMSYNKDEQGAGLLDVVAAIKKLK